MQFVHVNNWLFDDLLLDATSFFMRAVRIKKQIEVFHTRMKVIGL